MGRVAEQQFLCVHGTGRVDVKAQACRLPAAQLVDRIGVDVAVKVTIAIAGTPVIKAPAELSVA